MRLPAKSSRTSTQAISVPITTLTSDDQQRHHDGEPERGERLGRGDRRPEVATSRRSNDFDDDRRQRDEHEQAEPQRGEPEPERAAAAERADRRAAGRTGARGGGGPARAVAALLLVNRDTLLRSMP